MGLMAIIILTSIYTANTSGNELETVPQSDININGLGINPFNPPVMLSNQLSEGLTKIGQLDVDFGNAFSVIQAETNLLFVSGLSGGVTFIDVSNKSDPQVLGNYWNGGEIVDALYKDGYCYTANLETGIETLDYSDYNDITSIGSFYDGGQCHDLEFIGFTTLYAADGSGGLEIFRVNTPGNFTKVKAEKFGVSQVLGIRADPLNNIAFLMCGSDGIVVLEISRPTTPQVITILKDGITNAQKADSSALALYVADGENGLKIYNYSDQNNIHLTSQFEISSGFCNFFEWDVAKKAYMTDGNYLYQLNITDLYSITDLWKIDFPLGQPKGILSVTSDIYLCNDYDFKVIDISNKSNPIVRAEITFAGEPSATAVSGNVAVLAEGLTGIDIIDISNPIEPSLISKYEDESGGTSFYDVAIKGNYVFCATSSGLEIVSISDINNPVLVRKVNSGFSQIIEVSGNYAYLSVSGKDLVVIEITNPATASEKKTLNCAGLPLDIAIEGSYAYIAVGAPGFQKIDITTPTSPTIVDSQDTTNAKGVAISGSVLGVADGTAGVKFYDVSVIGSITFLDSDLTSGYDFAKIAIDGNDAYAAAYDDGIMLINITDTSNVAKIAHFSDGGEDIQLTVVNELVYAADTIDSFEIVGKDTDLDALADYTEVNVWGTDPNDNDTDDDLLLDGVEVDYWQDRGVNPLSDWDNDGLANIIDQDSDNDTIWDGVEVYTYGSDPINLDSDDDLVSDEDEVNTYFTHPADPDTDDDWILDGEEIYGYYVPDEYPVNPAENTSGYINGLDPLDNDTDNDIPWDGWEVLYGFNPLVPDSGTDSDGDGLTEAEEFVWGTNPFDTDTDDDTLTDGDEVDIYGTDPTKSDTDDDYIPDNWEIDYGLDPLNTTDGTANYDEDDLTNYEEYFFGTDPFDWDTDDDGMSDSWEAYNGTDPLRDDADEDLDLDGWTNYEEYLAGTDPNDPDTDDDGFIDSIDPDPLDPDVYPVTIPTTPPAGIETFVILSLFVYASISLVLFQRMKKKN